MAELAGGVVFALVVFGLGIGLTVLIIKVFQIK